MKKVDLFDYFTLAENTRLFSLAIQADEIKGADLFFKGNELMDSLVRFREIDHGFTACMRVATDLHAAIRSAIGTRFYKREGEKTGLDFEKLDLMIPHWELHQIREKVQSFRTVFEAECREIDVYSIDQVGIFKMSMLVSRGSYTLDDETRGSISELAVNEIDSAGRCLAFDLPTACGFHSLRALELVMAAYLRSFGVPNNKMSNWGKCISEAKRLIESNEVQEKPSPKVIAMLDRVKDLERNPLMHPEDTLDRKSAVMVFQLCAMTITEMVKHKGDACGGVRKRADLLTGSLLVGNAFANLFLRAEGSAGDPLFAEPAAPDEKMVDDSGR